MKNLSSDLEDIIKGFGLYDFFRIYFIRRDFPKLLRPPLSDHLYPSYLQKGQLLITVDSHEWLYEIKIHRDEIVGKLKPYGITNIRFKLGKVFKKRSRREEPPFPPVEIPQDLIDSVTSNIKDVHLQDSFVKAIGVSLQRDSKRRLSGKYSIKRGL
jgi:hypothetical protein